MPRELKPNKRPVKIADWLNIAGLFAPPALFGLCLMLVAKFHPDYGWLTDLGQWPWQLWAILASGTIATAGGVGDWRFHRSWVTVGPNEHHSHVLALFSGGVPLFIFMALASIIPTPEQVLLPIIAVTLYTTALICYDEFVYHMRRDCVPIETLFHRLLVFGNGLAWMSWMHWCYVAHRTL